MSSTPPPESAPRPQRQRVRRAPNIAQFLIAGALIGVLVGLWIGRGSTGNGYSNATGMGFMALIFGMLGTLVAGIVVVLLDRRSLR